MTKSFKEMAIEKINNTATATTYFAITTAINAVAYALLAIADELRKNKNEKI